MTASLAAQAYEAEQARSASDGLEIIAEYWARYDPTGEVRARLSRAPGDRIENSRAIAARMDAEWRARQTEASA